jgi:hypothetical protein
VFFKAKVDMAAAPPLLPASLLVLQTPPRAATAATAAVTPA